MAKHVVTAGPVNI